MCSATSVYPLRQIAGLLPALDTVPNGPQPDLAETLSAQVNVLRERRAGIDRVLTAVEKSTPGARPRTARLDPLPTILKEITMQEDTNWTETYYSPEARTAIEQGPQWTPELQAKISADWATLFADVESAIASNLDIHSPAAQALATRWMTLVGAFTQGNPEVLKGLNKLYADRENWPKTDKPMHNPVKPELMAWIKSVQAAQQS